MDEDGIGLVLARASELRSKIINFIHRGFNSSALQQQQWYERETALAEIVYSRKKLLKKLKECKGEDLEVIHETITFASEIVEYNNDLLLLPYPSRPSHSLALDNDYLSHFPSTHKLPQNGLINSGMSIETKNSLHESERKLTQSGSQNPLKGLRLFVNTTAKTMLTLVGVISILGLASFETRPLGNVRSLLFESLRNLSWGYGSALNYRMGVPLLEDVVQSMEQAIKAKEEKRSLRSWAGGLNSRSPPQPQARQNGGLIKNGSNVISACQSHNVVVFLEIEDTREPSKRKSGKKGESFSREILEQHFHLTRLNAASKLNVSESTLKRRCRKLDISKWPSRKRNKVKPVDESVPSAEANDPTLSTSPSLLSTVVVLDQPKPPSSKLQREKGKSLCSITEVGFGQFERLLDHMPGGYHNELRVQAGILQ
ncbi:hypothetical protein TEA_018856 [Camellia sinensis var. sinensis]|uniref:RWP-RK domain-containing protein n=1 Tax=Camellia sinensis var. sinensis TaxID=542762 RepID=A0A4S4E6Z4_CAMSN|nr:hypothetical protein TEA_018856 [Camellia sinensis var. sinensis]